MQADDALGTGHAGGDLAHEQRGGVGGEHRVGCHDAGERAEERPLDREVLRRRLDHDSAGREILEHGAPLDAVDALPRRRVGIVQHHAQARVARRGGDPGAHRPGAGDPERRPVEVHGRGGYARAVPVAIELFSLVMIAIFVGFLGGILLLGFYSPRSGADVLNWRPTRSPEAESQNELDDVAQMLEASNAMRRRRGAAERTEDDIAAAVDADRRELGQRARDYGEPDA